MSERAESKVRMACPWARGRSRLLSGSSSAWRGRPGPACSAKPPRHSEAWRVGHTRRNIGQSFWVLPCAVHGWEAWRRCSRLHLRLAVAAVFVFSSILSPALSLPGFPLPGFFIRFVFPEVSGTLSQILSEGKRVTGVTLGFQEASDSCSALGKFC